MSNHESETVKRELAKVRTENRRLTTQLTHADTKLREYRDGNLYIVVIVKSWVNKQAGS